MELKELDWSDMKKRWGKVRKRERRWEHEWMSWNVKGCDSVWGGVGRSEGSWGQMRRLLQWFSCPCRSHTASAVNSQCNNHSCLLEEPPGDHQWRYSCETNNKSSRDRVETLVQKLLLDKYSVTCYSQTTLLLCLFGSAASLAHKANWVW